ncbi:MAG: hypothetical protein GPJ54_20950 [Candidatus Heimdallarchaeota archaeon]|nr:hypothetical protein [Candidatus Heimdallarchaeota archaeon]
MRLFTLIGIILLLILPFSIVRTTTESVAGDSTSVNYLGLLNFRSTFEAPTLGFDFEDSESFQTDWIDEDGVYDAYFGNLFVFGLLILILLIVGLGVAATETTTNNSTYILMVSGILLLILRFLYLSDLDSSFYEKTNLLGTTSTSIEFPVGFVIAMIFVLLDFRQGSKE